MTNLNCLRLYVREDGIFARVFRGSEVRDGALRETVTEETLRQVLRTLLIRLLKSNDPISQYSFTVTYVLSRKVSVLGRAIATFLSGLSFVDSVCELRRDEVFFHAAVQLSKKNGNAPTADRMTHVSATQTKPSCAYKLLFFGVRRTSSPPAAS